MLTDIEIELIDKLCSDNGWDFWWYAPNTSPTVACSLRFKDVGRDNTTEFDKDSVADIQTFAKASVKPRMATMWIMKPTFG